MRRKRVRKTTKDCLREANTLIRDLDSDAEIKQQVSRLVRQMIQSYAENEPVR